MERITTKPQHYMRTVAVKDSADGETLTVTFDSTHNPHPSARARTEKKYSHVISTMSFGCLRMVDLDQLQMSYGQRNAIRQLMHTPSVKIGLQFKTAWWEKLSIVGGQSSTDRPIRENPIQTIKIQIVDCGLQWNAGFSVAWGSDEGEKYS